MIQVAKYTLIGSLRLTADYQEMQNLKIHHLIVNNQNTIPGSLLSTEFICSLAEANTHRKTNLDHTP